MDDRDDARAFAFAVVVSAVLLGMIIGLAIAYGMRLVATP